MKVTPALKKELAQWLDTYWTTYLKGDIETWATFLRDDYRNIGGTKEEIWNSKQEIIDYTNSILDQMLGAAEIRNREIEVIPYGEYMMVNEFTDLYVKIEGEWTFYGPFRMSSLLEKTDTGWIALHQHGSYPDMKAMEGEAFSIDAVKAENARLLAAVKSRTLELEIEAALEKVRAVAMSMKKPEDMLEVCRVISDQLDVFEIEKIRNVQIAIIDENIGQYLCYQYFTPYEKTTIEKTEYLKSPVEHGMVRQMLASRDGYFIGRLSSKELEDFRIHRKEENHFPDPFLDKATELDYCFLSIGEGGLGLTLYQPMAEDVLTLFKRFHQVFSLAYQRFRDIQKAELQAREAQIEAALERVRAQTMAMHSSDDVGKSVVKMFSELTALGVDEGTRFGIGILNHDNENNQLWTARKTEEEVKMHIGNIDMASHPLLKSARKAWKEQVPLHKYVLEGEDLLNYYQMLNQAPDYKIQIPIEKLPKKEIQHCFIFEHGFFYAFSPREFQPDLIHITKRFSSLFEQTYRRYLDLVRAEGQAREAEIELALERVRARTMAMHHTEDLKEVIQVVFDQFVGLNIHVDHAGFILDYKEREDMHIWLADHQQGVPTEITFPYFNSPHWNSYLEAKAKQDSFFANLLPFEVKNQFYQGLFELIPELTEEAQQAIFSKPALAISTVLLDNVGLYIEHYSETPFTAEENAILMRFGKVFQQTYTRFLDLQKAEAQAREAQIEGALERIRSRSLAMHTSDELEDVIMVVSEQLQQLQFRFHNVSFSSNNEQSDITFWLATPGKTKPLLIKAPYLDTPALTRIIDARKNGIDFLADVLSTEENQEWLQHTVYNSQSNLTEDDKKILLTKKGMARSTVLTKNITLMLVNYAVILFTDEQNFILKRFGNVFDQSYTRFLDLQKAEAQARESQIQLALERVRARTMAMQHSEELAETSTEMFRQMQALGMRPWACGFNIFEKNEKAVTQWMSGGDGSLSTPFTTPLTEDPFFIRIYEARQRREELFVMESRGHELEETYKYMFGLPTAKKALGDILAIGFEMPKFQISHCAFFSQGYLMFITYEPYPEAHDIFRRFAKVFEQTYTRFLDLQKAEAQAREAQIQLAMERVRARTMAMQHSSELGETSALLFQQIQTLGVPPWACGFNIWDQGDTVFTSYMGSPDGAILGGVKIPLTEEATFIHFQESRDRGDKLFVDVLEGETLEAHYRYFLTLPGIKEAMEKRAQAGEHRPTFQINHLANFSHGNLMFITYEPCPEAHDIFIRFAKVFEQTYTRFLDLQKAEAQAREARIEAALERVRSRSMAMHKTDELQEVVRVVAEELKHTGVILDTWGAVICTYFQDSKDVLHWTASEDPANPSIAFLLPYFKDELFDEAWESKERGDSYFAKVFSFEVKNAFFNHAFEHSDYRQLPDDYKKLILESENHGIAWAWAKNSAIMIPSIQGDLPSEDEKEILIRFAKVFEQSFIRFLDLQNAEAQAREAQIEAALERVRSKTMGMQRSEQLGETASLLFKQFDNLGIHVWSSGFQIWNADDISSTAWMSSAGGEIQSTGLRLPHTEDPYFINIYNARHNPDRFFVMESKGKELEDTYRYMFNIPEWKKAFGDIEASGFPIPKYQITHSVYFTHGYLMLITHESYPEYWDIFKRFGKVFDQTYTRFLDLQKAEAQAREAQIEAALERVRSRSLAMHHSSELSSVVDTLLREFTNLEFTLTFCIINLIDEQHMSNTVWAANPEEGKDPESYYMKFEDYPFHHAMWDAWKAQKKRFVYTIEGEEKNIYDEYLYSETEFRRFPKHVQDANKALERYVAGFTFFKYSGLQTVSVNSISEDELEILERFGRVFEQAYTRFLDLQKAEAQAREARVEASLEKVRSRTMAMQKGEELKDVAVLLYKELIALGVTNFVTCGYVEIDEKINRQYTWVTGPGGDTLGLFYLPLTGDATFDERYAAWKNQQTVFHQTVAGEVRSNHLEYAITTFNSKEAEEMVRSQFPDPTVFYCFNFSHGYLHIVGGSRLKTEEEELLARFTKVFEQTYIRFLDLQKAEAQAREAIKQASLDRVRAVIASMRSATDLELITPLIFRELTILGVPFIRCGVFIIQEKQEIVEAYLSSPDGNSLGVLRLPYQASELTHQTVEAWRKGEVYKQHWNKADFIQWINQLMEHDQIQDSSTYQGAAAPPESLDLHFVPFTQGMLYVGAVSTLGEKELELVRALAKAFSIAYARYEDFVKLEQAKSEVESAMSELKATQSQLVQQEKLASLGQLTAGIAHEIKNPLNFVNNFSEVSIEMIEEALEEMEKPLLPISQDARPASPAGRDETLIKDNLEDIKSNLQKVHEHGSRANGIVTSMLQHSRGGSGKKEPTDLNALIKEYVNLCFHGMRAGKNPINVDIVLDLDDKIVNVPIIKEDFIRVIINLCNNAFDAMREKTKMYNVPSLPAGEAGKMYQEGVHSEVKYLPKLKVTTILENGRVRISFEDNGPGIPDEIKDKILQPFFTTKKGTEGTGLGLSITHDIIKAHGGEIQVETKDGEGSEFIIILPDNTI